MSDARFPDRYDSQHGGDACPRCGAHEVIPDAQLRQRGEMVDNLRLFAFGRPGAWLFKKRKSSKIRARVCTACGHVDFYAQDPAALREAYEERNAPQ